MVTQFRPGSRPFDELADALISLLEPELSETDKLVEVSKLATALQQGDLALERVIERIFHNNTESDRLLLVADQFEELYTLCPDVEARHRFLDALLAAIADQGKQRQPTLTLLLTLRADFLGQGWHHAVCGRIGVGHTRKHAVGAQCFVQRRDGLAHGGQVEVERVGHGHRLGI